jgi:hypothetical protein
MSNKNITSLFKTYSKSLFHGVNGCGPVLQQMINCKHDTATLIYIEKNQVKVFYSYNETNETYIVNFVTNEKNVGACLFIRQLADKRVIINVDVQLTISGRNTSEPIYDDYNFVLNPNTWYNMNVTEEITDGVKQYIFQDISPVDPQLPPPGKCAEITFLSTEKLVDLDRCRTAAGPEPAYSTAEMKNAQSLCLKFVATLENFLNNEMKKMVLKEDQREKIIHVLIAGSSAGSLQKHRAVTNGKFANDSSSLRSSLLLNTKTAKAHLPQLFPKPTTDLFLYRKPEAGKTLFYTGNSTNSKYKYGPEDWVITKNSGVASSSASSAGAVKPRPPIIERFSIDDIETPKAPLQNIIDKVVEEELKTDTALQKALRGGETLLGFNFVKGDKLYHPTILLLESDFMSQAPAEGGGGSAEESILHPVTGAKCTEFMVETTTPPMATNFIKYKYQGGKLQPITAGNSASSSSGADANPAGKPIDFVRETFFSKGGDFSVFGIRSDIDIRVSLHPDLFEKYYWEFCVLI